MGRHGDRRQRGVKDDSEVPGLSFWETGRDTGGLVQMGRSVSWERGGALRHWVQISKALKARSQGIHRVPGEARGPSQAPSTTRAMLLPQCLDLLAERALPHSPRPPLPSPPPHQLSRSQGPAELPVSQYDHRRTQSL